MNEQELQEYNLKRQAIQNTITWEFDMWRRQTQAAWEIEQLEREEQYRQELETDLKKRKQEIDEQTLKQNLNTKNKLLNDLILKCNQEQKQVEKLKIQLQDQNAQAQQQYQKFCNDLQQKFKTQKNVILSKASSQRNRAQEMEKRQEFYKQKFNEVDAKIQAEQKIIDQKKQEIVEINEDDLMIQLREIELKNEDILDQLSQLEGVKNQMYVQYQRTIKIEHELRYEE